MMSKLNNFLTDDLQKLKIIEYDLIKNILTNDFLNFLRQINSPLEKINNIYYLPLFWIKEYEKMENNKND